MYSPEGIKVRYPCTCGYRGAWLTGRRSRGGSRAAGRHDVGDSLGNRTLLALCRM